MYTITLRGEQKLAPNFSVFARLGAQYATNPVLADFNQAAYSENTKAVVALDQYGFIYKPNKLTVTLARNLPMTPMEMAFHSAATAPWVNTRLAGSP